MREGGRGLRTWQQAALAGYHERGPADFLLTATPGAGKTTFALALAEQLLAARAVARVIVVCPTDHLRSQWARAAADRGLALDPTLTNAVGPVPTGFLGYVTTYAQVAGKPLLHRRRTEARRALVILDEIHHAGDGLSWGDAVSEAFEPAARRVALTGTPFRTRTDEKIPFIRYEPGPEDTVESVADFSYGYREALADGVVRPVVFAAYAGTTRWRNSAGEVIAASLSEPLTRDVEGQAWRTALDPRGQWVPHVLAAMDDRISHLRAAGMADAAGLVLASDQDDARAYADIAARITGQRPVLITSDDPRASDRLTTFIHGTDRLAVCVRMISEGVDVPRAACLAWMTAYRTPLFFAQAIGRVVRSRRPGESATVFLPAVRPLLTLAAELEDERNHVLAAPPSGQDLLDPLPPSAAEQGGTRWEALEAEAEFAHVLHAGRAVLAPPPAADEADADFLGLPGLLSAEQTAALLARRDLDLRRRARAGRSDAPSPEVDPAVDPALPGAGRARWEETAGLRREVNQLVARVAARTGDPHAVVHSRLRRAVPGPGSATAGAELLARRRDHLLALL